MGHLYGLFFLVIFIPQATPTPQRPTSSLIPTLSYPPLNMNDATFSPHKVLISKYVLLFLFFSSLLCALLFSTTLVISPPHPILFSCPISQICSPHISKTHTRLTTSQNRKNKTKQATLLNGKYWLFDLEDDICAMPSEESTILIHTQCVAQILICYWP